VRTGITPPVDYASTEAYGRPAENARAAAPDLLVLRVFLATMLSSNPPSSTDLYGFG
jgi:hypothetical protein